MTQESTKKVLKDDLHNFYLTGIIVCICLGMGFSAVVLLKSHDLIYLLHSPETFLFPLLYRLGLSVASNPFFWLAIFFYWRLKKVHAGKFSIAWEIFLRAYFVFAIVMLGLALFNLTNRKAVEIKIDPLAKYRITQPVSQNEVAGFINEMRKEKDYEFYFKILSPDLMDSAAVEINNILAANETQTKLYNYLEDLLNEVIPMVTFFSHIDRPEEYYKGALQSPELHQELWSLLYEEFKLTVLGLYYKANYDPEFAFQWSYESREFAINLKAALTEMMK